MEHLPRVTYPFCGDDRTCLHCRCGACRQIGRKGLLAKPVHEELLMELLRGLIGLPVSVPPKKSLMKRLSGAVRETERIACRVAPLNCSVMILGPNGSGKESVAQLIQQHSGRKDKPFVAVNCGCIRGNLPHLSSSATCRGIYRCEKGYCRLF